MKFEFDKTKHEYYDNKVNTNYENTIIDNDSIICSNDNDNIREISDTSKQ